VEPKKASLRDYFRVLYYWKGIVAILFLAIALSTVLLSFLLPPVYEATTLLLVEREPRAPHLYREYGSASIPPSLSVAEKREELAKTQSEIIKSRHILETVAVKLGLDRKPEYRGELEEAVLDMKKRIKVSLKEETNIIKLGAEDNDAQMAARITNAIAETYVQWASEMRKAKTKGASGALAERIGTLDTELGDAESQLTRLKVEGDVAALKDEIQTTVAKLAEFKAEYEHTIADMEEKKTKLNMLKAGLREEEGLTKVSQMIGSPVVDTLKIKLLELELKRRQLLVKYHEDSEPLMGVEEEIAHTKNDLNEEIANIVNSLETDLAALEARQQALARIKNDYDTRLKGLSTVEAELKQLERDVKGKNELYLTLLGKQAEATLTESLESQLLINVKVIEEAKVPLHPIRPKKILNTIVGCLVGMISGMGGAFIREYWDHSLKTVDEVKRYLELPTIAKVPRVKAKAVSQYTAGAPISENFNALSASILSLCRERSITTLLIASADRNEGKSVVAANLAASLASQQDRRVLLIDGNLRQPAMNRFFGMNATNNLVDILTKDKVFKGETTDITNLSIVSTAGEVAEPSRLLASDAMHEFITSVKPKYEYIIIDSPALIAYPDAASLAFESEGIIFVVEFGKTRREVVARATSLLDRARSKLLGVVLNKVEYVIPETLYKRL
jgi:capsular exopolysaccharide synthesis family protein